MARVDERDSEIPSPQARDGLTGAAGGELTEPEKDDGRDPRMVRWNLAALIVDVSFFSIGMAFLDPSAVLPLLMERLDTSGTLIGAFAAIRSLAFSAVQIFVAYATHGRLRQKPPLVLVAGITRLPLLALPYFLSHAGESPSAQATARWATIGIMSVWALGDGLGYVPWMEIVARAFSDRTRGRFFASTQLISGIAGIGIAAFIVRPILNSPHLPFPMNYVWLTATTAVMMQISLVGILFVKEPPAPIKLRLEAAVRPALSDYFRRLPGLVRDNPIFARLSVIQLMVGFGAAAQPFYVIHAKNHFHLGDDWGGIYQVMLAVGMVVLMPAWTLLGERLGPAAAVRGVAFACLLTPLTALTVGSLSPWLYALVFLLMGGSLGWGMWIALNQFLLIHTDEDERPIFISLINLLFAPAAIYPFLGGLLVPEKQLVQWNGVPILFLLTALVVAFGFVLTLRLPAPNTEMPEQNRKDRR